MEKSLLEEEDEVAVTEKAEVSVMPLLLVEVPGETPSEVGPVLKKLLL